MFSYKIYRIFKTKPSNAGFSLVELAIVLLIIATLIVGVSQGYNMVSSAQISNARGITSKSPVSQTEGLIAWYEPAMLDSFKKNEIFNGAQLTEWKDSSTSSLLNGLNILTTSATANITYNRSAINKIPGVRFNGTTSKLSLASFNQGATSRSTIFLVFEPTYNPDSTNFRTLLDNGTNSPYSIAIRANAVMLNNGVSQTQSSTGVLSIAKDCILAVYFNGTNSQIYLNDTDTMLASSAFNLNGTNQLNGLTIGNNFAGNAGFTGFISEVIVFNRVIKESERREIFNYLSKKYRITVNGI